MNKYSITCDFSRNMCEEEDEDGEYYRVEEVDKYIATLKKQITELQYEPDTRTEAQAHFSSRQELKAEHIMRESRERTILSLKGHIDALERQITEMQKERKANGIQTYDV